MTDTIVEEIGGIQMKLDDLLRIEEDEVISQLQETSAQSFTFLQQRFADFDTNKITLRIQDLFDPLFLMQVYSDFKSIDPNDPESFNKTFTEEKIQTYRDAIRQAVATTFSEVLSMTNITSWEIIDVKERYENRYGRLNIS